MSRPKRRLAEEKPRSVEPLPVPDEAAALRRFYAGLRMPSPMGGFLERLGVRPEPDGSARVLLECSSSSLRFSLTVPASSRTEQRKVRAVLKEGDDPFCPRHGPAQRLIRSGSRWVCPACGVGYAKAD